MKYDSYNIKSEEFKGFSLFKALIAEVILTCKITHWHLFNSIIDLTCKELKYLLFEGLCLKDLCLKEWIQLFTLIFQSFAKHINSNCSTSKSSCYAAILLNQSPWHALIELTLTRAGSELGVWFIQFMVYCIRKLHHWSILFMHEFE